MPHEVVLIRHGQSQWNLENRFTGWHDVELTEKGEAEAARAGELSAVARSGSVAVSRGEVTLSSYDRNHRLSG